MPPLRYPGYERAPTDLATPPLGSRLAWTALLALLYVATSVLGWRHPLIFDEIWYLLHAARPLGEQVESLRLELVHPPLMYLLERVWMGAFGHSDNAVKALVACINLASISLFASLAPLVVRQWRLASFLFATAYLQVGGVPNLARSYSLGLLFTITALLAWELWRRQPKGAFLALWATSMFLLGYSHYVGLLLLGPFVLANWLYGHRRGLFMGSAVLVVGGFLPWFVSVLPVYLSRGLEYNVAWIDEGPWVALAKLPFHLLTYLPAGWNPLGENDWPITTSWRHLMMVAAVGIHAVLAFAARRRLRALWSPRAGQEETAARFWALFALAVFPAVVLIVFSLLVRPIFSARYLAFVLPMYWLLIVMLVEHGGGVARWALGFVVVPWLLAGIAVPLTRTLGTPGLHDSLAFVEDHIQPADLILAERLAGPQVYWQWTRAFRRPEPVIIVSSVRPPLDPPELPLSDLEDVSLDDVARVWFFETSYDRRNVMRIRAHLTGCGFQLTSVRANLPFLAVFERR